MTTPTHPADLLTFSDASEDEIRQAIAEWSWATGVASVTPIDARQGIVLVECPKDPDA